MTARLGTDDVDIYEFPGRELLLAITGVEPVPAGTHVLLDEHLGVRSTQRLALGEMRGGIALALWPAELKPQAAYLYSQGRGRAMVRAARDCDWTVRPSPHLAFFTSNSPQRLYMTPDLDPGAYATRWEGEDAQRIGQHSREAIRTELWPWLKERGYASSDGDTVLEDFLSVLGRRQAHLRAAMRFRRIWDATDLDRLDRGELAAEARSEINQILRAAGEPVLPPARI